MLFKTGGSAVCPEGVRPDLLRWSLARRNPRPLLEARHHTRDRALGMHGPCRREACPRWGLA
ncbi:hypothetical protein C4K23_3783 [Pseudomonas chlororaphis]|nr:hypothetical protein C4K23_3783 [Pseudomonas chlororaphis]